MAFVAEPARTGLASIGTPPVLNGATEGSAVLGISVQQEITAPTEETDFRHGKITGHLFHPVLVW